MILKSFEIGNFKSIGSPAQRINLKPLTLVFGPNSAGKSSILETLRYFNEDHANPEARFIQLVHEQHPKNVMLFGIETQVEREGSAINLTNVKYQWTVRLDEGINSKGYGHMLPLPGRARAQNLEIFSNGELLAKFLFNDYCHEWSLVSYTPKHDDGSEASLDDLNFVQLDVDDNRRGHKRFALPAQIYKFGHYEDVRGSEEVPLHRHYSSAVELLTDLLNQLHTEFNKLQSLRHISAIRALPSKSWRCEEDMDLSWRLAARNLEAVNRWLEILNPGHVYKLVLDTFFSSSTVDAASTDFLSEATRQIIVNDSYRFFNANHPVLVALEEFRDFIRTASSSDLNKLVTYHPAPRLWQVFCQNWDQFESQYGDLMRQSEENAMGDVEPEDPPPADSSLAEEYDDWDAATYDDAEEARYPYRSEDPHPPEPSEPEINPIDAFNDLQIKNCIQLVAKWESSNESDQTWDELGLEEKLAFGHSNQELFDLSIFWGGNEAASNTSFWIDQDPGFREAFENWLRNNAQLTEWVAEQSGQTDAAPRLSGLLQNRTDQSPRDRIQCLSLRDMRFNHPQGLAVGLEDVGFGISQVIPVIAHSVGSARELIAIEEPESHIHPRLQTKIGDLLMESALGERNNTFLLETHSEHLILRLLRRIRETSEGDFESWPEELRKACPDGIRPEDISILYVDSGKDGATITELTVTSDGDFDQPWPDGFFSEREKELF